MSPWRSVIAWFVAYIAGVSIHFTIQSDWKYILGALIAGISCAIVRAIIECSKNDEDEYLEYKPEPEPEVKRRWFKPEGF